MYVSGTKEDTLAPGRVSLPNQYSAL